MLTETYIKQSFCSKTSNRATILKDHVSLIMLVYDLWLSFSIIFLLLCFNGFPIRIWQMVKNTPKPIDLSYHCVAVEDSIQLGAQIHKNELILDC